MLRIALAGLAMVFALGTVSQADDKKTDDKAKLKGTWVREAEGLEIKIAFVKADEMTISVTAGDNSVKVINSYKVEKDGTIKGTVKDIEEKGEFPGKPPKGLEFSFKFKIDGKKATLTDFQAGDDEGAKAVVEGEYEAYKAD
jgi:hypothetical protein